MSEDRVEGCSVLHSQLLFLWVNKQEASHDWTVGLFVTFDQSWFCTHLFGSLAKTISNVTGNMQLLTSLLTVIARKQGYSQEKNEGKPISFQRSKSPYPKKEKVGTNEIQQELGVRSIKPGCYRSEKKSRINEN